MFERCYITGSSDFTLRLYLILIIVCSVVPTGALGDEIPIENRGTAKELNVFNTEQLRARYYALIGELRCPKCQNQNLADSDAPIATDLRNELQRLLHENYSDQQILAFMTARYGDFVLYKPPLNQQTLVLWLLPASLLVFCLFLLMRITKKEQPADILAKAEVNQNEQQHVDKQVEQLLHRLEEGQ